MTKTTTSAVRSLFLVLAAALLCAVEAQPARAVVVSTTTGNTSSPADDPGWDHVGARGNATAVYLGYRWVLTAAHLGSGSVELCGELYEYEVGTTVKLQNPTGMGLSAYTDLRLFRLQSDPGLPTLPIASTAPAAGAEVTMIGHGYNRAEDMTAWNITPSGSDWTWTETDPPGTKRGFKLSSGFQMRWGTNVIDRSLVFNIGTTENPIHIIGMQTDFDENYGATSFEAQCVAGDSGAGAFHKNGNQWELLGIINAMSRFPDQPWAAVYDNKTYFSDLTEYRDQILEIITPLPGDANLDGMVNDADAAILATNWQMPAGAIWSDGDFNGDGMVNDTDAAILATHWQEGTEATAPSHVPEPAALILLAGGLLSIFVWRWWTSREAE